MCGAARRACADDRSGRQRGNGSRAQQHVAHVLPLQHGTDGDFGGTDRLDVLGRMDRKVDLAGEQRRVEFLGPQRLSANLRQWPVLHLVAAGAHRHDLDHRLVQPGGGAQAFARLMRLRKGEGRAAGA